MYSLCWCPDLNRYKVCCVLLYVFISNLRCPIIRELFLHDILKDDTASYRFAGERTTSLVDSSMDRIRSSFSWVKPVFAHQMSVGLSSGLFVVSVRYNIHFAHHDQGSCSK